MLLGYVSDENYLALSDAQVEVHGHGIAPLSLRSSAAGAVYADIPEGIYDIALAQHGYGSKRSRGVDFKAGAPHQFRLGCIMAPCANTRFRPIQLHIAGGQVCRCALRVSA